MNADAMMTALDKLATELRSVAMAMATDSNGPGAEQWVDNGYELYLTAAMIDRWIAELAGEPE
jgi:hypothetical protein